jgi:hypothetical protein
MPTTTTKPARQAEDLAALAAQINRCHNVGMEYVESGLEFYHEAGVALLKAKERCGHGKWLAWVKANLKFTGRRAQQYMKLAKCEVTSDLEDAWRRIQGNECDEDAGPGEAPASTSGTPPQNEIVGTPTMRCVPSSSPWHGSRTGSSPWDRSGQWTWTTSAATSPAPSMHSVKHCPHAPRRC